jgi:hypothetical protein
VTLGVRNASSSSVSVGELRVTDATPATYEHFDLTAVELLSFPAGADRAHLLVCTAAGSDCADESDWSGGPVASSVGLLDLPGTLNDDVTADDLPSGSSPGAGNCASYRAQADISDSTGTTAGNACASLPVAARSSGGSGVKTVGQSTVPPGQPIPFTLTNNGNVALVDPVLNDPPVDAGGEPRAADNPFTVLSLVSATVRKDSGTPDVSVEVFDPDADAWVAYTASDSALLTRATGVRLLVDGELTPTKRVFLDLVTTRRTGVPDGVTLAGAFAFRVAALYLGWEEPLASVPKGTHLHDDN